MYFFRRAFLGILIFHCSNSYMTEKNSTSEDIKATLVELDKKLSNLKKMVISDVGILRKEIEDLKELNPKSHVFNLKYPINDSWIPIQVKNFTFITRIKYITHSDTGLYIGLEIGNTSSVIFSMLELSTTWGSRKDFIGDTIMSDKFKLNCPFEPGSVESFEIYIENGHLMNLEFFSIKISKYICSIE